VEVARASPVVARLLLNLSNNAVSIDTIGNGAITGVQVSLEDVVVAELFKVDVVTIFVLSLSQSNALMVEANEDVDLGSVRVVGVRLDLGNGDFGGGGAHAVEAEVLEAAVDQFLSGAQSLTAGGVDMGVMTVTAAAVADQTKVDVLVALALQSSLDGLGGGADMVSNVSLAKVDILLNNEDDVGFLANLFGPGLVQAVVLTANVVDAFVGWVDGAAQMDVGKSDVGPDGAASTQTALGVLDASLLVRSRVDDGKSLSQGATRIGEDGVANLLSLVLALDLVLDATAAFGLAGQFVGGHQLVDVLSQLAVGELEVVVLLVVVVAEKTKSLVMAPTVSLDQAVSVDGVAHDGQVAGTDGNLEIVTGTSDASVSFNEGQISRSG